MPVLYCTFCVPTAVLANSRSKVYGLQAPSGNLQLHGRCSRKAVELRAIPSAPAGDPREDMAAFATTGAPCPSAPPTLDVAVKGQVAVDASPTGGSASHIAIVHGGQLYSKCLRVSSESRAAALRFYRVHIPCRLRKLDVNGFPIIGRGIFHSNPEFDFLYLTADSPAQETVVDFLYRLKTVHDPQHIGLRNLGSSA